MNRIQRTALAVACVAAWGMSPDRAEAANWLMLQGTEPAGTTDRAYVWGFVQVDYQHDTSKPNSAGGYIPPMLLGPDLETQEGFNVSRARIGVRGVPLPLDSRVNYFVLLEGGNNGVTQIDGSSVKFTDASITLNHIPGVRVRSGLFKYPGAEEGLQAIQVFDYINFTEVTNQLLLERFPNRVHPGAGTNPAPCDPTITAACNLNRFDSPVGAFRDVGVQLFDAFTFGNFELSYAAMVGNGNGLNFSDNNDEKDLYLYLSTEWLFGGGVGPFREGLKFFVWSQNGERQFDGNNDGRYESYDRDRSGVGLKFLKKPWRFTAEYMQGEGMIWNGPDKATWALVPAGDVTPSHASNGLLAEGKGWYAEGGIYIPRTNFQVDLRYDYYARLDGSQFQLDWTAWTLGLQYHFNPKVRLTLNYTTREVEAVNFNTDGTGVGNPNANLRGIEDRYGIQLTAIF
jgi:hypothetical protein